MKSLFEAKFFDEKERYLFKDPENKVFSAFRNIYKAKH